MFVSFKRERKNCSLSPSHLSTPHEICQGPQNKVRLQKHQIKVTAESERASGKTTSGLKLQTRTKTITKSSAFVFVCFLTPHKKVLQQKSFSIESAFESFSGGTTTKQPRLDCVCAFPPIFHSAETKKNCRRCVWQPENVYNHLKYITVEYKRHYANRTYFCHFPS